MNNWVLETLDRGIYMKFSSSYLKNTMVCYNCKTRILVDRSIERIGLLGMDIIAECCSTPNYHFIQLEDTEPKEPRRLTESEKEKLATYLL